MAQTKGGDSNSKRNILIIIGGLLGLFFLWLAFRDISLVDLEDGVRKMKVWYLLPCLFLAISCQFVRAIRFGVILSPFCSLNVKSLWDLLNIWAAANMILPARLGELVRPYLLQQRGASFSSVFGSVMVERFFDLSGLLLLLGVVSAKNTGRSTKIFFPGNVFVNLSYFGLYPCARNLDKKRQSSFCFE